MEFTSINQLYKILIPAFNAKRRLIKHSKYKHITNENIWLYLTENKWKKSYGLTLSDMVNDIMIADLEEINKNIGDNREKI